MTTNNVPCQGGCGKVRSILFSDSPSDWLCNDCRTGAKPIHSGVTITDLMQMADTVITDNTLDGVGIPYYDEPEGVYRSSNEAEDALEQARRG